MPLEQLPHTLRQAGRRQDAHDEDAVVVVGAAPNEGGELGHDMLGALRQNSLRVGQQSRSGRRIAGDETNRRLEVGALALEKRC